jgi:hypothetical protein
LKKENTIKDQKEEIIRLEKELAQLKIDNEKKMRKLEILK